VIYIENKHVSKSKKDFVSGQVFLKKSPREIVVERDEDAIESILSSCTTDASD